MGLVLLLSVKQEKYRSALEAANIGIGELDAVADAAAAAAAGAEPTTAAVRTAVRRSLGGSSAHQLLGLPIPPSPAVAASAKPCSPVSVSPAAEKPAGTPSSQNTAASKRNSIADTGGKNLDQELAALQITEEEQQRCDETAADEADQAVDTAGMTSDSGAQIKSTTAGAGKKRKGKKGKKTITVAVEQPAAAGDEDAADAPADGDASLEGLDICELDAKEPTTNIKASSRSRRAGKGTTADQATADVAADSKAAEHTGATRRSTRRTKKDQMDVDGVDA